ncbi:MAG: hypothetical protein C7B47_03880 [Sulfobacillus thermosulfidooxidans]|uniref:Uncharacterized protein n=1 Tax=Sulfobacillus thermosulfidooxidans TaxID=28034 RepID=A0A2T2X2P0_SULTH|nr:MAG: hypothetical protein C7B47_03880 [Sulfobacillus thermosulfidooxidans]
MMKNIKDNQRVRRQVGRGIALAGSALVIGALPATITFAQSAPLAPTATPSAQLRLGLDQLLGEHATILELGMQALASGNQALMTLWIKTRPS